MLWRVNVAALDLGSNSFHLLVARVGALGRIEKLGSAKRTPRLGESVAATGLIPPEAFRTALDALGELAAEARRYPIDRMVTVGTSALRDADNGDDFVRAARARHGVHVELLSGTDEGRLVYEGARSRLEGVPRRAAVLDLGGGSLEVALGEGPGATLVESLPLGFLRVAHTLDARGSVDAGLRARVFEHVRTLGESLDERLRATPPEAWIFSGGMARAAANLAGIKPGEPMSRATLERLAEHSAHLQPNQLVGLGVAPERARTFALGITLLTAVTDLFRIPALRVSPGGIREGLVLRERFWALSELQPITAA
jgi:exopolyphosphatase/guanosine-5'-triphosphate,3'-diphosphate pyrophosphatase